MHTVTRIESRFGLSFYRFVKFFIKRYVNVRKFLCESTYDGNDLLVILAQKILVLSIENVGRYHYDLRIRSFAEKGKDSSVIQLYLRVCCKDI